LKGYCNEAKFQGGGVGGAKVENKKFNYSHCPSLFHFLLFFLATKGEWGVVCEIFFFYNFIVGCLMVGVVLLVKINISPCP